MKDFIVDGEIIGKEYGVVLQLGKDGESDIFCIKSPFIMYNNGIYKMWYSGYNGNKWEIYYATSKDGINWIKHGIVSILEDSDVDIDYSLYISLYNLKYNPSVIYDGEKFKMWYTSHDDIVGKIYYAVSMNGKIWKKQGLAIDIGGMYETDTVNVSDPSVIFDGSIFHMWYTGDDGENKRIHYATSEDGSYWIKHGVVIPISPHYSGCISNTYDPFVIYDDGIYKMWYTVSDFNNKNNKILYAISKDGRNWTKNSVIKSLLPDYHNSDLHIETPCVIKDGDVYKMWFSCYVDKKWLIHYTELLESNIIL